MDSARSDINIIAGTHPRASCPLTLELERCGLSFGRDQKPTQSLISVRDLVTVFSLLSFGHCHSWMNGESHASRDLRLIGFDVDGGVAQFVKLPLSVLDKLPDEKPGQIGPLIEPLAVAVRGIARTHFDHARLAAVSTLMRRGQCRICPLALLAVAFGAPPVVAQTVTNPQDLPPVDRTAFRDECRSRKLETLLQH